MKQKPWTRVGRLTIALSLTLALLPATSLQADTGSGPSPDPANEVHVESAEECMARWLSSPCVLPPLGLSLEQWATMLQALAEDTECREELTLAAETHLEAYQNCLKVLPPMHITCEQLALCMAQQEPYLDAGVTYVH